MHALQDMSKGLWICLLNSLKAQLYNDKSSYRPYYEFIRKY